MKVISKSILVAVWATLAVPHLANSSAELTSAKYAMAAAGGLPSINFCGEKVPTHKEAVAERMVSAMVRGAALKSNLYGIRERAADFFPAIEPVLKKYDIPADFKYLPIAESDLISHAKSRVGAAGYWQLMPGTARDLGLKVGNGHDERYNLEKATEAVCHHLRYLYKELGNWTLVAAAYNGGLGHVRSRMRQQGEQDFYDLKLFSETGFYIFRILAYKEMLTKPLQYSPIISTTALTYLIQPLPGQGNTVDLPGHGHRYVSFAFNADTSWGPHSIRSLLATSGVVRKKSREEEQGQEQDGVPYKAVMGGVLVLRDRLPRFRRWVKGITRHWWEWL
ncbi:lytic transglycosylase domain-containing protein [Nibrella saemangeumensis]